MRIYYTTNTMETPIEWVQNVKYLNVCLDIKKHKRFRNSDAVYSEDLWMGLTVEQYCKEYPIRINSTNGLYTNFD